MIKIILQKRGTKESAIVSCMRQREVVPSIGLGSRRGSPLYHNELM
jgi:hypothetical protein